MPTLPLITPLPKKKSGGSRWRPASRHESGGEPGSLALRLALYDRMCTLRTSLVGSVPPLRSFLSTVSRAESAPAAPASGRSAIVLRVLCVCNFYHPLRSLSSLGEHTSLQDTYPRAHLVVCWFGATGVRRQRKRELGTERIGVACFANHLQRRGERPDARPPPDTTDPPPTSPPHPPRPLFFPPSPPASLPPWLSLSPFFSVFLPSLRARWRKLRAL